MSERGVFAVDRGIWDHPMFATREPLSKREAWLWLVSEASWKPKAVFVDGKRVQLDRGQLAHSIRFLADKWGWPKSNVVRFLDLLKTETMIGTETGRGITIITVCKYEEYQRVSLPDRDSKRDADGTQVGHKRDKEEDIKHIEEDVVEERAKVPLISPEAIEVTKQVGALVGYPTPPDWPPGWMGAPYRVQTWLSEGWKPELILIAVQEAMAKKRDGPPKSINYFEGPIASAHAKQSAPLPKVQVSEAKVIHVNRQPDQRPGGSIVQTAKRQLAEELAEYERKWGPIDLSGERAEGARPEGADGEGDGYPALRLISPR